MNGPFNHMRLINSLLITISVTFSIDVCSQEETVESNDIEEDVMDVVEEESLLALLEKHTDIATRSRLNADHVPGIVTVLDGRDLESRGVRDLWEAMAIVPGFEITLKSDGKRIVQARGNGKTFSFGIIKFLLNSVPINLPTTGLPASIFSIPIAQIDRIDVIRGPGSALHGEFAYAGVVNIITVNDVNKVYFGTGSYDTYDGGAIYSWRDDSKDMQLSINVAGFKTDGADILTGPDLIAGVGLPSNAPGPANEDRDGKWLFANFSYQKFDLLVNFGEAGHGDHFGVSYNLPPNEDRIVGRNRDLAIEARQRWKAVEGVDLSFNLGYAYTEFDSDRFYLAPGMVAGPHYEQGRLRGGVHMNLTKIEGHELLFGMEYSKDDLYVVNWRTNYLPTSPPTLLPDIVTLDGIYNWMLEDRTRTIYSLILQDEFSILDNMKLTGGVRYDEYLDVGGTVMPRLATVWNLTDRHILKIQYAEAFRPPSFIEMYGINNPVARGNPDINPETVRTIEFGYIFKSVHHKLRTTIFHSRFEDLISIKNGSFYNGDSLRGTGVEVEVESRLASNMIVDGNVSYTKTRDATTKGESTGVAPLLANVGVKYIPWKGVQLNLQYCHIGSIERQQGDVREDMESANTIDMTVSLSNLYKGLTLKSGIKDLFDNGVKYPGTQLLTPFGPGITYYEDIPRPGRRWWLQLAYEF